MRVRPLRAGRFLGDGPVLCSAAARTVKNRHLGKPFFSYRAYFAILSAAQPRGAATPSVSCRRSKHSVHYQRARLFARTCATETWNPLNFNSTFRPGPRVIETLTLLCCPCVLRSLLRLLLLSPDNRARIVFSSVGALIKDRRFPYVSIVSAYPPRSTLLDILFHSTCGKPTGKRPSFEIKPPWMTHNRMQLRRAASEGEPRS